MIAGLDDHRVLYGMILWAINTGGAAGQSPLVRTPGHVQIEELTDRGHWLAS